MRKFITNLVLFGMLLATPLAFGQRGGQRPLRVQEVDGDPVATRVNKIVVNNGTITKTTESEIEIAFPETSPGGNDTEIQFNDGGTFGGDSDFIYNKTTKAVALNGPLTLTSTSEPQFTIDNSATDDAVINLKSSSTRYSQIKNIQGTATRGYISFNYLGDLSLYSGNASASGWALQCYGKINGLI